jgi:hypothetical protein
MVRSLTVDGAECLLLVEVCSGGSGLVNILIPQPDGTYLNYRAWHDRLDHAVTRRGAMTEADVRACAQHLAAHPEVAGSRAEDRRR